MSGLWLETVYCDQGSGDRDSNSSNISLDIHQKIHQRLDMDVKKTMLLELDSELVITERLFEVCDKQGSGRVKVSDIMDYLSTIVNQPFSENGDFKTLIQILDPDNVNTEVDLAMFKAGLHQWIEEMKAYQSMTTDTNLTADESLLHNGSVRLNMFMDSQVEDCCIIEESSTLSDVLSKLADAQHQCQRITDENRETRALLEVKEEELISTCRELSETRMEMKRLQEMSDILHEAQAENSELRQHILAADRELYDNKQAMQQAKMEIINLEQQIESFEAQLASVNSELSMSIQNEESLRDSLKEFKEKWIHLTEMCSSLETQLAQKNERIQILEESLEDVSKYCEDMKFQKQELLEKLTESELELSRFKSFHQTTGSVPVLLPNSEDLIELTESEPRDLDVQYARASSICNELKDLLSSTPDLPWPLSDKDINDSVLTAPDLISHSTNCDLIAADKELNRSKECCEVNTKDREVHYDISNEKLRFLYTLLTNFKDENRRLRCFAKHLIYIEHKRCDISPSDIVLTAVDKIDCDATENSLKYFREYNTMLITQITKLKRSNIELAEKLHKSELKLTELHQEAQNTNAYLERERQKCADLEENLCSSTLARQLDLRDIWRLVQKDVETECQEQQEDAFSAIDSEQIKEKIKRDIEVLRSKLHHREATLGTLQKQSSTSSGLFNCSHLQHSMNWYASGQRLSPGSTLVDALTIDVLNGNLPTYPVKMPSPISCEDVDCYECRAARLVAQNRYTSSCPSISPLDGQLIHNYNYSQNNLGYKGDTGIDANFLAQNAAPITAMATSQQPSTHKRQRSLYGSNRRQDFIKRSGKRTAVRSLQSMSSDHQMDSFEILHSGYKTGQLTQEDFSSISSNHDNTKANSNETNHLVRRPSFRKAVEGFNAEYSTRSDESNLMETSLTETSLMDSISDELRRPSFCAAIEQGKEENIPTVYRKKKIVPINAPETLRVRTKQMRNDSEPSKTVTFQLEEKTADTFCEDQCSSVSSSYYCRLPSSVTSLQPPFFSSYMSSPQETDHSLFLSDTPQNYKLQLFLEDVQAYTVPKSMEDWDMAPQSTGGVYFRYDQDQEHIENLSDPDQELPDVSTYMNESDDMQESVNLSSQKKEPVHVHGTKDNSAILDLDVKNIQIKSSIAPHQGAGRPALSAKHDPAPASASNISQPPTPSASLEALPPLPVPHNSSGGTEAGRGSLSTNGGGTHKLSSAIPSSGIQATSETHKLHLANKRKDQIKSRNMKLPELSENSELDITSAGISPINPCTLSPSHSSPSKDKGMPQISVTDYLEPPPPTDDPVTPSLPSSFLKKLGLSVKEMSPSSQIEENGESEVSVDQLPQKELESKFISLSLAFKTDKFTLQQRVKVQERSRDLAEQNVDSEIKSLRELLESLYEQVSEPQARTIVQKLRQNIDVLEQTAARVSSRAEVYGAVQQEQRMCQALEVMVLYTENLKRIREREESELLEARKVLSERTVNGYSVDTDSTSGRRSMSVSGISPGGRPMPTISSSLHCVTESGDYTKHSCMRRRSEIALPKVLGGSGSPSMIQTASLETASPFLDRSYPSFNLLGVFAETGEDPKSRFQSAVASMSMQHAVTSTVRQASLEKQRSMSFTPSLSPSSSLGSPFSPSTPSHQSISSVTESGRKISQDEDAFRKGYEEGLKAKLSRELNELREQQNCISHNLEHMMDRVDQTEQEEEEFLSRPTRLDTLLGYSTRFTQKLLQHDWRSNKKLIRNLAGFFLVFLAIFIVFLSPPISTVDIRQITRPPT
ncbi:uncharacterized protein LOC106059497 isoform X5 [Biomphalaria glabrata]|uniref:Uncharacterized protein LOC106059497 isoform X5 n=1 Tax=Biomphalaria glabrata TaxID=6526 RepID=A0A9W3AP19_BIOGL|nr:uncharacterized protein LOC106059497 isoform X5 [Biomphalaria glabrata]